MFRSASTLVYAMVVLVGFGLAAQPVAAQVGSVGDHEDGSWVSVLPSGEIEVTALAAGEAPQVSIDRSDSSGLSLSVSTEGLLLSNVQTKGGQFVEVGWPENAVMGLVGEPALPVVRHLFVAPMGVEVSATSVAGEGRLLSLSDAGFATLVKPVQAPIVKLPGELEKAPFDYNETAYSNGSTLPVDRVTIEELGIVRGQRLFMLEVRPVAYNPVASQLTYWPDVQVSVRFDGVAEASNGLSPLPGLSNVVLNPEALPAASRGTGNFLIIVAAAYESGIADFVTAKQMQGFSVSTWVPPSANASTIKSHIQGLWGGFDSPDYVLLVGDTNTIPSWTGGGEGSPATDLPYGCMDGSSDWYPDIAVGRFSVRSAGQLEAIIDKTLYYQDGAFSDPDYLTRAVFMSSEDNWSITEGTHNWVINNYMIPNEFTYERLYSHTYNATTQQVRNAFNDGKIFGIFSGHGGTYSWADGPSFSQSDVSNLTNNEMYPFVWSFACITGTYTVDECFTETWSRVANRGSIAIYGSSVNSYWTEDDVLEKRLFDTIYDVDDDVRSEVGPVWNEARMRYLAQMGSGSTTRRYFEMYNLLGDPSTEFPNAGPIQLSMALSGSIPEDVLPGVTTNISVRINQGDDTYVEGSGKLHYRFDDGEFAEVSLVAAGEGLYIGTLPAASCGDVPEFYFSASGDLTGNITYPPRAPYDAFTTIVGERVVFMTEDFESDSGWTVRNSTNPELTDGAWERGVPVDCGRGDPSTDSDGSGQCFLTDNDASSGCNSDVDEGYSWLISPDIDLSSGDAEISVDIWYTNNEGNFPNDDIFRIWVTNNNWVNWNLAVVIGPSSGAGWTTHTFRVGDFVTPNDHVQVRFEVSDLEGASVVEAGVDNFIVSRWECYAPPSCDDGVKNQDEEKIDCGGESCSPCECIAIGDCDDDLFCNGMESCDEFGHCQSAVDPACEIGTWCDEAGDQCLAFGDGDFEQDGDVDLGDFLEFQACFGQTALGVCGPGNMVGDDGVIDLDDYAEFLQVMAGP